MRIVSLLPSATEIACALGLREQLVGISHECDYPEDLAALPVLTRSILASGLSPKQIDSAVREAKLDARPLYTVDGPTLQALAPDLVLTQGVCSVCAVTPETIEASLGLTPLDAALDAPILSLAATQVEGIFADIETVARAARVEARGRALHRELAAAWAQLDTQTTSVRSNSSPRPSVFFLEWPDPPWFAGHWVPEQIAVAGGRDCFATAGSVSRTVPWEQVAAADPDWIIVGACGCDLAQNLSWARTLREHPIASTLRAVRAGRVWAVDANAYFSRPGPRVVAGAQLLAAILGERTQAIDPRAAQQLS